ncbi:hypothetical protein GCM10010405_09090 [Streptomyces macrosporus]|uniref:Uncharacterized protein n=1 Tax=Streptomyces macrosporus TaxID=44032 RepID=A0ABN3JH43_9ACTN
MNDQAADARTAAPSPQTLAALRGSPREQHRLRRKPPRRTAELPPVRTDRARRRRAGKAGR